MSHLKKFISIALIFILSGQSLYKLGLVTYFQLNRTYISKVLCINKEKPITMCYGNCFLKRNLKLAEASEKSNLPASEKYSIEIPSFIISENDYLLQLQEHSITLVHHNPSPTELGGFPSSIFHPPADLILV